MLKKLGYLIYLILVLSFLFVLLRKVLIQYQEQFGPRPTVVYKSLPTYGENEQPFYQSITPSPFTGLNTFKGVVAVSNYEYDNPFLVLNNTILIAGFIEDENNRFQVRTSIELFSADISTGQVYWQTAVGSNQLATDRNYVFAETIRQNPPGGVIAFDLHSGKEIWQTSLDFKYAVGVEYLTIVRSDLIAESFNRGFSAQYILNPTSGEIKERYHTLLINRNPIYNNLVFSKDTQGRIGPVIVTLESNGSITWRYDQPVVSNIAVGGPVTYFVTKSTQLVAVDTMTGNVLGILSFTPTFPEDFHFEYEHIIVAADGNTVAVYFRDKQQLSLFHFENSPSPLGVSGTLEQQDNP